MKTRAPMLVVLCLAACAGSGTPAPVPPARSSEPAPPIAPASTSPPTATASSSAAPSASTPPPLPLPADGPPSDMKPPIVSVTMSGGIAGLRSGFAIDADGRVAWWGLCRGRGPVTAEGHVAPEKVRALVAQLRSSHVFDASGPARGTGCADDIIDTIALDEGSGEPASASAGRCDQKPDANRVREAVERANDLAGRPPACR